jgi:UbiD family decarboxylase
MRAFRDLREFLQVLDAQQQLLKITDGVALEPDLAASARAVNQVAGETSPALYFNRIKGYQSAEVVMNAHGSWLNFALILDMPKDATLNQQFFEFIPAMGSFRARSSRWTVLHGRKSCLEKTSTCSRPYRCSV